MPAAANDPFPIASARTWATGAVHAMSVADAYWLQDDPRVDETLDEAIAGLDEARARLVALREQRRPRRPLVAACVLTLLTAMPWFVAPDLAHAAADMARDVEPFRWNGLSFLAVLVGAVVILFIPLRSRK